MFDPFLVARVGIISTELYTNASVADRGLAPLSSVSALVTQSVAIVSAMAITFPQAKILRRALVLCSELTQPLSQGRTDSTIAELEDSMQSLRDRCSDRYVVL